MARHIILIILALLILAASALWIIAGGPRRVVEGTRSALSGVVPTKDELAGFRLPWQPVELFPTLDITDVLDLTQDETSPRDQLIALQAEYDRLSEESSRLRTFGTPSPYTGKIAIMHDVAGVRAPNAQDEYIQLSASYTNNESIDISGWTLESALTGTRVALPPAASPYLPNAANVVRGALLEPGNLAIVSSAPSPIGMSFRENMCSGYLQQFQSFSPPLADECLAPSGVLPLTGENLSRYGDACFDAIAQLPRCRFPNNLPTDISGSCRAFLTEFLSYGGCVSTNRHRDSFTSDTWRLYLGSSVELWRNSHDAIRLLDAHGRTVSVFVY